MNKTSVTHWLKGVILRCNSDIIHAILRQSADLIVSTISDEGA